MEKLRYYIAHNSGLHVMRVNSTGLQSWGECFGGRTLEHLEGRRRRPEVVFAAVAFDGGYRTVDGGRTWQKIMDGDVRTFAIDPSASILVAANQVPYLLREGAKVTVSV